MWPFRQKKTNDAEQEWTVSTLRAKNGDLAGTHLVMRNALRFCKEHGYAVFVTLSYEGGPLPSSEEMQRFDQFDSELAERLAKCQGLNVGVITLGGIRDWICYVSDGEAAANLIYSELSAYSPKIEVKLDPTWSEYRSFAAMGNP